MRGSNRVNYKMYTGLRKSNGKVQMILAIVKASATPTPEEVLGESNY